MSAARHDSKARCTSKWDERVGGDAWDGCGEGGKGTHLNAEAGATLDNEKVRVSFS